MNKSEIALKQALDSINKAKEAINTKRNEEDRKYIVSGIGKDLVSILTPLLQEISNNARMNRDDLRAILSEITIEAPKVQVSAPNVNVAPTKVDVPKIEFPKDALIKAIKEAIKGIKVSSPDVKIPDMPKEMKVAKIEELITEVKKLADAKMTVEFDNKFNRDNPLPVILTDEDGRFYKAIAQMVSTGGGGGMGVGAMKFDGSGNLQVNVAAGSAAGTEYTEGDVDATINAPAVLFEGPGNALTPPLVDANGHVQVDVLSGGGGGTLVTDGQAVNAADTGTLLAGTDGANYQFISTTAAGLVNIADGGGAITVDGTVTINDTAAADLAHIHADADSIVTSVQLIDNAVDGNYLNVNLNIAGTDATSGAGAEANTLRVTIANDSTGLLSVDDNGASLSIDDGGNVITVDGTVAVTNADITSCKTALELLDNSVDGNYLNVNMNLAGTDAQANEGTITASTLRVTIATDDDAVTSLGNLDNAVDGNYLNVNMNIAGSDVSATVPMPVRPNEYELNGNTTHVKKYYTNAGAVNDGIIWSPAAGKRWYVTDIFLQTSAAATVTLEDDLAGGDSAIWKAELAANSGWSHSFQTPWFSGEDAADLIITTSAGNIYVMVTGYEI